MLSGIICSQFQSDNLNTVEQLLPTDQCYFKIQNKREMRIPH